MLTKIDWINDNFQARPCLDSVHRERGSGESFITGFMPTNDVQSVVC